MHCNWPTDHAIDHSSIGLNRLTIQLVFNEVSLFTFSKGTHGFYVTVPKNYLHFYFCCFSFRFKMVTNLVFITELLSSQSSPVLGPSLTSLPLITASLWNCSKQIVSHGLMGDVLPPISSTLSPSSGDAIWNRRSVSAGPVERINYQCSGAFTYTKRLRLRRHHEQNQLPVTSKCRLTDADIWGRLSL